MIRLVHLEKQMLHCHGVYILAPQGTWQSSCLKTDFLCFVCCQSLVPRQGFPCKCHPTLSVLSVLHRPSGRVFCLFYKSRKWACLWKCLIMCQLIFTIEFFPFKFLVHLEFILVEGVRWESNFIFLDGYSVVQHDGWKAIFLCWFFLCHLSRVLRFHRHLGLLPPFHFWPAHPFCLSCTWQTQRLWTAETVTHVFQSERDSERLSSVAFKTLCRLFLVVCFRKSLKLVYLVKKKKQIFLEFYSETCEICRWP